MRPSFESAKEMGVCYICGDKVAIPPGLYHRGDRMHKHCYLQRKRVEYGEEVLEPILSGVEDKLKSLLANMGPMIP